MQAVLDNAIPYMHVREAFGQKIGHFQVGLCIYMFKVVAASSLKIPFFSAAHARQDGRHVHPAELVSAVFVQRCSSL